MDIKWISNILDNQLIFLIYPAKWPNIRWFQFLLREDFLFSQCYIFVSKIFGLCFRQLVGQNMPFVAGTFQKKLYQDTRHKINLTVIIQLKVEQQTSGYS